MNHRGTVEHELGGKTWKLVPDFEAFQKIQGYTGKTAFQLCQGFSERLDPVEAAYLFKALADSGKSYPTPSPQDLFRLMQEDGGFQKHLSVCVSCLIEALSPPEETEKKTMNGSQVDTE